ncbi:MAG TPA: phosphoadenosine phosphosulfate reductase family protein [Cyclobacteriaceae bacterium]|nr:phosphoadenosine phosphosulfate reductase family protein [Cyclobacteriaceae bacterium]HMX00941.1 phosphoadenosine phosphosulfate reductase family protein [Cyclobacteriaceae bacterium]HMX50016.1 phosphoadenosine phosphosulfate reductase family protein [Cyclobacteriaceae bacterium]HMY93745.1 phosphoadenosine phosphosulfate reductase family protein [Cyclobacteriaceae bacterium]HNA12600.1 phosphoadenosine phosphosulfate reductase family protein [Cyclobacteriaceae bacterium]
MKKVRHVLGISGGKDSAALAIYMKDKYPELDIEYYTCDTGKELDETYQLINNLEVYLGKKIVRLQAADGSNESPFDHFLKMYGGFLPSSNSRWCTKVLKLVPFEKYVGDDPVISYVGIRGDEDREGYISKKSNVQSIFPFRKNIWSEDVIAKMLPNNNIENLNAIFSNLPRTQYTKKIDEILRQPLTQNFTLNQKLNLLLDAHTETFNNLVFAFLKTTAYPLAQAESFQLLSNNDVLVRDDIFRLLRESGVGVPEYYEKRQFDSNGKTGEYARSRSGCYFCFFQQKIEWIWLYEQHPHLFAKAMQYEKQGYTWNQEESLEELIKPERVRKIKEEYLKRTQRQSNNNKSHYLLDILDEVEGEGCASCFI